MELRCYLSDALQRRIGAGVEHLDFRPSDVDFERIYPVDPVTLQKGFEVDTTNFDRTFIALGGIENARLEIV